MAVYGKLCWQQPVLRVESLTHPITKVIFFLLSMRRHCGKSLPLMYNDNKVNMTYSIPQGKVNNEREIFKTVADVKYLVLVSVLVSLDLLSVTSARFTGANKT